MAWHFVKVRREGKVKLDYGWMLKLDTIASLLEYHERSEIPAMSEAIAETAGCLQRKTHPIKRLPSVLFVLASVGGKSVVDIGASLEFTKMANQAEAIGRFGSIYVGRLGGYFMGGKECIEYDYLDREELVFPELAPKDVRIIQWPGGSHYYAKIGNTDVVVGGEQKWDTKMAAENAAAQYLRTMGRE